MPKLPMVRPYYGSVGVTTYVYNSDGLLTGKLTRNSTSFYYKSYLPRGAGMEGHGTRASG